ncbi:siderophore-interacting protein [Actinoplanes bogorensis]|uniref:Siderophore-interacting protein n=1 Tax=Paractinoplanes bogorensis TaxID=1610840 RepID=A0ABS5YF31_9ACTN|nr:siderophore-interacting protein [Actinoplanes bogorensis]MBU2662049.1 siderophore-interacting protein [Actinoplanes bogorensis]
MGRGWEGAVIKVLGGRDHVLTMTGRREITPHFVRLSFAAPTLFSKVRPEPAAWLRFWIPDPDGGKREYQRAYTISEADEAAGTIEVDFVLHEPAGPASAWATTVEPGSQVAVVSLGSQPFELVDGVSGLLLVADAASIPAVNGILRTLKAGVDVELVLEQGHAEDDQIPLVARPGLTVHRVPREGADSLATAVSEKLRPGWQFWAAGESGSLKAVRALARGRAGASKDNTYTQAYWIEGKAMGKGRDGA